MINKIVEFIFVKKKDSFEITAQNEVRDLIPISERFKNWIEKINLNELPNKDIVAYNFGLFKSNDSYKMYLIGSNKFDIDDEN
jgi:hypothetical protein